MRSYSVDSFFYWVEYGEFFDFIVPAVKVDEKFHDAPGWLLKKYFCDNFEVLFIFLVDGSLMEFFDDFKAI